MIFVSFMANPDYSGEDFAGIFYGGDGSFLGNQIYGMFVYSAWTLGTSGVMFFTLMQIGWFRVSEEEENLGVDVSHHGGKAYPIDDTHLLADSSPATSTTNEQEQKLEEPLMTEEVHAPEEVAI